MPVSCRESHRKKNATANLAQWWLEGSWAMVLSEGLVLKWDYRLIWKKEEKGKVDVQASKRAEIFKCRQTHSRKRDHFIIISGGEARRGRRLLRGMETVCWDVISAVEWRLKTERFTRVCVSVCKSITGAVQGGVWIKWSVFFPLLVRSFLWPLPRSLSFLSEPE